MERIFRGPAKRAVAIVLLGAGLAGCPLPPGGIKIAVIHYDQIGACNTATLPDGTVTAPPGHAIVLFRIKTIDNTAPPVTWQFNPGTLQVNSPSDEQSNLGSMGGPVTVPANGIVNVNRPVGIMVGGTINPDGSDAATYNYTLLYPQVAPAPGTISVNDTRDIHNFPWNPNCNALIGG
jgi:hypothetical protein